MSLPESVDPEVQPPYGPTGEIFRFTLQSPTRDSRELLTLHNWIIDRQLRSVAGVADVVAFWRAREIVRNPGQPDAVSQVRHYPAGGVSGRYAQQHQRRGRRDRAQRTGIRRAGGWGCWPRQPTLKNLLIEDLSGNPVLVRDVAEVAESNLPRVGQVGLNTDDDVVEGIVVMRKRRESQRSAGAGEGKKSMISTPACCRRT